VRRPHQRFDEKRRFELARARRAPNSHLGCLMAEKTKVEPMRIKSCRGGNAMYIAGAMFSGQNNTIMALTASKVSNRSKPKGPVLLAPHSMIVGSEYGARKNPQKAVGRITLLSECPRRPPRDGCIRLSEGSQHQKSSSASSCRFFLLRTVRSIGSDNAN
jgi:hypothetical protein